MHSSNDTSRLNASTAARFHVTCHLPACCQSSAHRLIEVAGLTLLLEACNGLLSIGSRLVHSHAVLLDSRSEGIIEALVLLLGICTYSRRGWVRAVLRGPVLPDQPRGPR